LDERANAYIRDFGVRANFRAALHCGPVVIGELGTVKMEIAFLGDTMNTAARLQQACRDTGQRVLASAALVNCLAAMPPGVAKRSIGRLRLRGKENEIELYALAAAGSATRAGGARPFPLEQAEAVNKDKQARVTKRPNLPPGRRCC
jgi:adenylate cyclase